MGWEAHPRLFARALPTDRTGSKLPHLHRGMLYFAEKSSFMS